MIVYEILYYSQPEVLAILSRAGWNPPSEGYVVAEEPDPVFDYYDKLMRQPPRR